MEILFCFWWEKGKQDGEAYYKNSNQYHRLLMFSHSVVSDILPPHGLQHARLPCPSPSPGVCSNSCPLSQWCHPAIPSSVIPSSSCLQSFAATGSFPVSSSIRWPKYWSFSFSISTSNDYLGLISTKIDWFDLLAVQGFSTAFFKVQLSYLYMTNGKIIVLIMHIFVSNVSAFPYVV